MSVQALAGYDAAVHGLAVAARADRARVRVTGRDPVGMLEGVITNRIPEPARAAVDQGTRGSALYAAVLTPKGKMVTDLRVVRGPRSDEDGLLLDVPASALAGALAHFGRYLPPRFARAADVSAVTAQLTVAGPRAAEWLARDALGLRVEGRELGALAENEWVWLGAGGAGVLVIRSGDLAATGFDVLTDAETAAALERGARAADGAALSPAELDVLRIEAGRPTWGAELGEDTLPPEAGIDARAIDHSKGCYTGQEVIVRIRDRGHVNRRLRGIRLGAAPLPVRGTELWAEGRDRPVGVVTSAAASPRAGEGLALGYVRREVKARDGLRLGTSSGPSVSVAELGEGWWRL
jgi:folate-binding protein YgfZ